LQPRGKQSESYHSHGCDYTRTTGIWQTVWLESVPKVYISRLKLTPDPMNQAVHLFAEAKGAALGAYLSVESSFEGRPTGNIRVQLNGDIAEATLSLSELHLWG